MSNKLKVRCICGNGRMEEFAKECKVCNPSKVKLSKVKHRESCITKNFNNASCICDVPEIPAKPPILKVSKCCEKCWVNYEHNAGHVCKNNKCECHTPKSKERKIKAWARFHGSQLDFASGLKRECICQCSPKNDDGSCMFGHKVVPITITYK